MVSSVQRTLFLYVLQKLFSDYQSSEISLVTDAPLQADEHDLFQPELR